MKVLLQIRKDAGSRKGGDYFQLLSTQSELNKLGVATHVCLGVERFVKGYDLVHSFNTLRIHEPWQQWRIAQQAGTPLVLTPIWHSREALKRLYRRNYHLPAAGYAPYSGLREFYYAMRSRMRPSLRATVSYYKCQRQLVLGSDLLLPNSTAEMDILQREIGLSGLPHRVVYSGFHRQPLAQDGDGPRSDVLCVGRIEPLKNQLGVMQAFERLPPSRHRLLFIGAENRSHPRYLARFHDQLNYERMRYLGELPQSELFAHYARCKGLIHASFFETTGLIGMEALSCGANVCLTGNDYTREYYQDHASYCDPYDAQSIQIGIQEIIRQPNRDHLTFLESYSWRSAAVETLRSYEKLLRRDS